MKNCWRVAGLVLSLLVSGCNNAASSPDRVSSRGLTRVASVGFEAPFLYQKNQETVGPEAEFASRVVERLNARLEAAGERANELFWISREYPNLISSVQNGEAEFAVGLVGITSERQARVDFSDSYYTSQLVLVMNPSANPVSADELKGLRIGVREGTAVQDWTVSQHADSEIVPYASLNEALLSLRRAEIGAVIEDREMAAYSLDTVTGMKHIEIVPGVLATLPVGAAVGKGNQALLEILNEVASEMKAGDFVKELSVHSGDRAERVEKRHPERLAREKKAVEPRSLVMKVVKEKGSPFDIYKLANLRFAVSDSKTGRVVRTSRIEFKKRTGFSRSRIPPGRYNLSLPKFGIEIGRITIQPDDGKNVIYNVRWTKSNSIKLEAAS